MRTAAVIVHNGHDGRDLRTAPMGKARGQDGTYRHAGVQADLPPGRPNRQDGSGLVEVLVTLFLLTAVATAFVTAMAAFQQGFARAELLRGAVACTSYVVERVRGGFMTVPDQAVVGGCAEAGWPNLGYRLVPAVVTGDGGGNASWRAISVTVYPSAQVGVPEAAIYQLTTSAWVRPH